MSTVRSHPLPAGHALFARYAFPPNELGYCGPPDSEVLLVRRDAAEVRHQAREFDGAWPYLSTIGAITGSDPLDADVVRSYWIGGPLLRRVEPAALLSILRTAFQGQVTGILKDVEPSPAVLAHHSFHVFVVYPWVRFLDRDSATAIRVLQNCRVRWGTVTAVESEHVVIDSCPLIVDDGRLRLGSAQAERVRWCRDGASLIAAPGLGSLVAAHWDWACDTLSGSDRDALAAATTATLTMVNEIRGREHTR